ncbi:hypothetical protein BUALT_Bualt11G0050700 [Buddleja alternifolia]|uniref:Reverse transcriptase domain-containing protein n=1 Tax=Buddleja alternifolia TaxID=168488 RepID=A0AAV6WUD3_9LAMI|nr:hypothetical protein BUALT_Bualt11G0050700 [Buddleja alternifolia]
MNHTFIALIPKCNKPILAKKFRPISLCNVAHKMCSKITASRLKLHLDNLISPTQMAFVPNRNICDNSIISHEKMHYLHNTRGKKGFMAIKVDMAKAYDRVEWSLLCSILERFGFSKKFVHLIHQCMSTTSFSVLINGSPFGMINPSRGIRQGDPFSPYLFIIYFELLSRMLTRLENLNLINGIKVTRKSPSFTHLMYADDLVIYCQANSENANIVQKCLSSFESWSGLSISKPKSVVHFSRNVDPGLKSVLLSILDINECCHKIKHLGLPFCKQQSRTSCFNELVESLQSKLSGWKSKNLSQAGRLILLKSVAQALPVYHMSNFLLPIRICEKLDACMRSFFWGHNPSQRKLSLKCWDEICLPKPLGGLGLCKMHDLNHALNTKFAWKLTENGNCLWASLFWAKYLNSSNILNYVGQGSNASWTWIDILKCRDVLTKGSCFSISANSKILTWLEPWIPSLVGFIPPPSFSSSVCVSYALVDSLIEPITNDWDFDNSLEAFPPSIAHAIFKIKISSSSDPPALFWTPSASGKFSVKRAFSSICNPPRCSSSHFSSTNPLFKKIWSSRLHERHKIFI